MKVCNLFLILVIFSFIGCSKENQGVFDFRLQTTLDLPFGLNTLETHYFFIRDIPTFYASNLSARGLDPGAIKLVNASKGVFTSRFSGSSLNFIRYITVSAVSRKAPFKKVEMFYLEDVPFNSNSDIKLLTSLGDLKELISEEKIDIEIRLQFRAYPPPGVSLQLDYGYLVQI